VTSEPAEFLNATLARWRDDPVAFVRECFGVEPYPWQYIALRLVAKPETRRLAFKACKGPGKTTCLAWIILWFLATRFESKVGCTSITEANIDANLWPELSLWMSKSRFITAAFVWTTTRVSRRGEAGARWFAEKRSWPKTGTQEAQANALAGFHADHVMFVLDESGGIPQGVMVAADAVLANAAVGSGREAKVIQSGNPTHTTGPLYRACTVDRALWELVEISGDPDRADRAPNIDPVWAREQITSYGRDNPWVMVNVLGEFPPSSINALLGVEDVNAAMRRHLRIDQYEWAQKRLGVDVARFGDDRTIIFPRQGLASFWPIVLRNLRTTEIAARVMLCMKRWKGCEIALIDDTGHWGHGVLDNLITGGWPAIGINYAGKAVDPRYRNRRAEFWMLGAEAIKNGAALAADSRDGAGVHRADVHVCEWRVHPRRERPSEGALGPQPRLRGRLHADVRAPGCAGRVDAAPERPAACRAGRRPVSHGERRRG
jgi:phage terminase large subunit